MNKTFTYRQLEADPSLCVGMKRLWQDSEGKTVTYQVIEPKPADCGMMVVTEIADDGQVWVKPKSKAKGKRTA